MVKLIVPIMAILCITFLESLAISKGMDGIALTTSVALLAGVGGYKVRDVFRYGPGR